MPVGSGKQCSPHYARRLRFTTGQSRVCANYSVTSGDGCLLQELHLNLLSTTKLRVDSKLSSAKIMGLESSGLKSGEYSGTSDKGPSETGTTSLQRTLVAALC